MEWPEENWMVVDEPGVPRELKITVSELELNCMKSGNSTLNRFPLFPGRGTGVFSGTDLPW